MPLGINSTDADECPTVATNRHHFFFVSSRPGGCGGQDLWMSFRRDRDSQTWEEPQNLGCEINTSFNDFTPTHFEDEEGVSTLYFTSCRPGCDIYASTQRADGTWGPGVPVAELNTESNDSRPNVSRDGLEVYFESNRPGTLGLQDVWVSTRPSTSSAWSTPVNLGPDVNSTAADGRPSLAFDKTTLYFHSTRPGGAGGTDLYVTTRSKQTGKPE